LAPLLQSEEIAKTLVKEFPKVSLAMVVLGEAMSHPSSGKLTTEQLDEIGKLADEALELEKKSDGKEWWRSLEPKSNTTLFRILKLKGLVDGRTKVSSYSGISPFVAMVFVYFVNSNT
jgi:hypothetical protein